jgi:hypothetical protein
VEKTDDMPENPPYVSVLEIKKQLMNIRGVTIRESLEVCTAREKILEIDKSDPNF